MPGSQQCPVCGRFCPIVGPPNAGQVEIGATAVVECPTHGTLAS